MSKVILVTGAGPRGGRGRRAGADAIEAAEAKARELLAQADASRELGSNLTYDHTDA